MVNTYRDNVLVLLITWIFLTEGKKEVFFKCFRYFPCHIFNWFSMSTSHISSVRFLEDQLVLMASGVLMILGRGIEPLKLSLILPAAVMIGPPPLMLLPGAGAGAVLSPFSAPLSAPSIRAVLAAAVTSLAAVPSTYKEKAMYYKAFCIEVYYKKMKSTQILAFITQILAFLKLLYLVLRVYKLLISISDRFIIYLCKKAVSVIYSKC